LNHISSQTCSSSVLILCPASWWTLSKGLWQVPGYQMDA